MQHDEVSSVQRYFRIRVPTGANERMNHHSLADWSHRGSELETNSHAQLFFRRIRNAGGRSEKDKISREQNRRGLSLRVASRIPLADGSIEECIDRPPLSSYDTTTEERTLAYHCSPYS